MTFYKDKLSTNAVRWGLLLCLSITLDQELHAQVFTQVTQIGIVNDGGNSRAAVWGDYDGDGHLDLFVANGWTGAAERNFLYRSLGSGDFERITEGSIANDIGNSTYGAWGDYDQDGDLDLLVTNAAGQNNSLYKNNANGTFTRITAGILVNDGGDTRSGSWGDFDNDGDLDVFIANSVGQNNALYRNLGNDQFEKVVSSPLSTDGGISIFSVWIDYDEDGDVDLFVANGGGASGQANFLYQNRLFEDGAALFQRVVTGSIVTDAEASVAANWIDFDHDGDLDLFVTNILGFNNSIYRSNGDGTFTKSVQNLQINASLGTLGSSWGDYDNDGDLDVLLGNGPTPLALYRSSSGTGFSLVTDEPIGNFKFVEQGVSWADFDNDGDLDLFVTNSGITNNLLYRNDQSNGNHWLNVTLKGVISNTTAIGARVRVKAVIGGNSYWQSEAITGLSGYFAHNSLNAEFGLGDALLVDSVVIEWPSSIRQVLTNVSVNQMLAITEDTNLATKPFLGALQNQEAIVSLPLSIAVTSFGSPTPVLSLTQAPSGMAIDSPGGLITWTPSEGQSGSHPVTVAAANSGGSMSRSFTVEVFDLPTVSVVQNPVLNSYADIVIISPAELLSAPQVSLSVNSTSAGTVQMTSVAGGLNAYAGSVEFTQNATYTIISNVETLGGISVDQSRDFNVALVKPEAGTLLKTPDTRAVAIIPAGAVRQSIYFTAQSNPHGLLEYTFGPVAELDKEVDLVFTVPADFLEDGNVAVVERKSGSGWELMTGEYAPHRTNVTIRTTRLGVFRIAHRTFDELEKFLPKEVQLQQNFPNPFNPSTSIRYTLPHSEKVELSIYNNAGQLVKVLVDARRTAGAHTVVWDGRNAAGSLVSSGVYLFRLRTAHISYTRKMLLIK